ncbi:hypothetical protein SAMN05216404_105112 [Nitrosospira multiformis]|uniref:Autotransporter domain-containing protein n=2 Tax=Nitrosospira multiformis TaxID=1231 RepID=A0A1H8HFY7_9PROT|nr:hypothetical protein SAMN05216404_105112 [Nitrosospira multiformis]
MLPPLYAQPAPPFNAFEFIPSGSQLPSDIPVEGLVTTTSPNAILALINADHVLESSNGYPMRTLLEPGATSFEVTGNLGRNDHQGLKGNFGNGQVRFAYNLGFAQFNLAAGGIWSDNTALRTSSIRVTNPNPDIGGTLTFPNTYKTATTLHGAYVTPEIIARVPGTPLHVTLTGLYFPGEINPNVTTLGGRVRADWLNAFKIGKASFTPYGSYTYVHTKVGRFLEKTVLWDKDSDHVNLVRYGIDAVYRLHPKINLLTRIEGAHRFEGNSNNDQGLNEGVMGGIQGLGQAYTQDWVRGGVGVEGKLGKSLAGIMLNATSQGPVTSYWLSISYKPTFK